MSRLSEAHCNPCDGNTPALSGDAVEPYMRQLDPRWSNESDDRIRGTFKFDNYYQTQAFVNAVAYIAHREDHHPDITFGYNSAEITLATHAIEGLSENDFIVAARIDSLVE